MNNAKIPTFILTRKESASLEGKAPIELAQKPVFEHAIGRVCRNRLAIWLFKETRLSREAPTVVKLYRHPVANVCCGGEKGRLQLHFQNVRLFGDARIVRIKAYYQPIGRQATGLPVCSDADSAGKTLEHLTGRTQCQTLDEQRDQATLAQGREKING